MKLADKDSLSSKFIRYFKAYYVISFFQCNVGGANLAYFRRILLLQYFVTYYTRQLLGAVIIRIESIRINPKLFYN